MTTILSYSDYQRFSLYNKFIEIDEEAEIIEETFSQKDKS